ncbi:aromatic-ring-hydroxylating dioxygenase subunit beta [Bacillus sp. Marseille-P3661]|uniref:aromatic-ring-hydroxylating dioxygenase subunit beta n=1 Tax=Bacillus sp. Marseille-P3661 TaxID=1936234 RepID=UPI000C83CBAE|nr:3-phenylpropionate/cinnamic acid dioxygenase subunit beta [Bacillus sp. Marseille-P3661]
MNATNADVNTKMELEEFLLYEAELLDDHLYNQWLDLFTEDCKYEMPMNLTKIKGDGKELSDRYKLLDETYETLKIRIERLGTDFAWAEDPPSRTRHYVTNVRVKPGDKENEFKVRCNLLVYRNRGDYSTYDLFSADRNDIIRNVDGSWKIAYRQIVLDQRSVNSHNLSIFF